MAAEIAAAKTGRTLAAPWSELTRADSEDGRRVSLDEILSFAPGRYDTDAFIRNAKTLRKNAADASVVQVVNAIEAAIHEERARVAADNMLRGAALAASIGALVAFPLGAALLGVAFTPALLFTAGCAVLGAATAYWSSKR